MMGLSRAVVRRGAALRPLYQVQKAGVISGPPRVQISFVEKVVSGVILTTSITVPSFYFMGQILNYRSREEA